LERLPPSFTRETCFSAVASPSSKGSCRIFSPPPGICLRRRPPTFQLEKLARSVVGPAVGSEPPSDAFRKTSKRQSAVTPAGGPKKAQAAPFSAPFPRIGTEDPHLVCRTRCRLPRDAMQKPCDFATTLRRCVQAATTRTGEKTSRGKVCSRSYRVPFSARNGTYATAWSYRVRNEKNRVTVQGADGCARGSVASGARVGTGRIVHRRPFPKR
jgi:hypothetical protein